MQVPDLNRLLGNIDLYWLDQLLKGRLPEQARLLDAGCGEGRNAVYPMHLGHEVHGIDEHPGAIQMMRFVARAVRADYPTQRFIEGQLQALPYEAHFFDAVVCNAVLHFARTHGQFQVMLSELVRVLKPGGLLFIRTASLMGLDLPTQAAEGDMHGLPDGSLRYLLGRERWERLMQKHALRYLEQLKVVSVDGQRGMATLVLTKDA